MTNLTVQLLITLVHIQPRPQMFKQLYTMMKTDCELEEVLGNHAEISPKVASEKAQKMMSENRYTYLMIDFFGGSFYHI